MKKIMLLLSVIGLILFVGSASAAEFMTTSDNPDSLINYLDPSNAPVPEGGLVGLTEEGLPGAGGSAAGGIATNPDSLVNYLDPSNAPGASVPSVMTKGVMRDNPDTIIHFISPPGN